jgi:putative intracellular protease/amidase
LLAGPSLSATFEANSTIGAPMATLAWPQPAPVSPIFAQRPAPVATRRTRPWILAAVAVAAIGAVLSGAFALRAVQSLLDENSPRVTDANSAASSRNSPPVEAASAAPSAPGINLAPGINSVAAPPTTVQPAVALIVIPHSGMYYPDYEPVARVFDSNGVSFQIAATTAGPAKPYWNSEGPTVAAHLRLADVRVQDYRAVVFLGGAIEEYTEGDGAEAARSVISQAQSGGLLLASLCRGTEVLAAAGALDGKRAAKSDYFPKPKLRELMSSGARWMEEPLVRDGRVITASDYRIAERFGDALVLALREPAEAR